jgi:hypothetical protein
MLAKNLEGKIDGIVKVIFKEHDERFPMIGKFVHLTDAKELWHKNLIRFVNQSKLDFWNDSEPNIGLTKIYNFGDFAQVIKMS